MNEKQFLWTFVRALVLSLAVDIFIAVGMGMFFFGGLAGVIISVLTYRQVVGGAIVGGIGFGISIITVFCLVENGKLERIKGRLIGALLSVNVWLITLALIRYLP